MARTVDQAVNDCYLGYVATAAKRGRNPRWPYVPIIKRPRNDIGRPDLFTTEQIQRVAFATRQEATAHAEKTVAFWRARFREQLLTPKMRAVRAQWGVELPL